MEADDNNSSSSSSNQSDSELREWCGIMDEDYQTTWQVGDSVATEQKQNFPRKID